MWPAWAQLSRQRPFSGIDDIPSLSIPLPGIAQPIQDSSKTQALIPCLAFEKAVFLRGGPARGSRFSAGTKVAKSRLGISFLRCSTKKESQ
jgi:hypothetical protein